MPPKGERLIHDVCTSIGTLVRVVRLYILHVSSAKMKSNVKGEIIK